MSILDDAAEIGATFLGGDRCRFRVWAPLAERVEVRLLARDAKAADRLVPLVRLEWGYHAADVDGVPAGSRYFYRLYGRLDRPDPASRFQPDGVHCASAVVDLRFAWTDRDWRGRPLDELIFYELHVGTFTPEGTFDAAIAELDTLKDLGITAIELMPVAQFPGERNWGYDGVHPFAVQNTYGGPWALQCFVNACHLRGLAVVLDVVHNHLGPEGNYLADFGPYFSDRHRTPWGPALNLDGPHSDPVRAMFIVNSLDWIEQFHIDALRLDAVHALVDQGVVPFLAELSDAVHALAKKLDRRVHLIAESNQNDPRLTRSLSEHGLGIDAQWNDDFHHSLHALLTGEHDGYYRDFGKIDDLAKAIRGGFVLTGQHSYHRQRRWGLPADDVAADQLVVCSQNHDQTGNRRDGERLSTLLKKGDWLGAGQQQREKPNDRDVPVPFFQQGSDTVDFESLKLAAMLTILSPNLPLLFMGEEYGELAPFLYFTSHGDPDLIAGVREGRKRDFASFDWRAEPPDPQSPDTFAKSKLQLALRMHGRHAQLWQFYQTLIRLRKTIPALATLDKQRLEVRTSELPPVVVVRRWDETSEVCLLASFARQTVQLAPSLLTDTVSGAASIWHKQLDSADSQWGGPGEMLPARLGGRTKITLPSRSAALFVRAPT